MEEHGDQRLKELFAAAQALSEKKQADYGRPDDPFANVKASAEWGVDPWVGAMVRLNDKVRRLQAHAQGDTLVNENAYDSFLDIAVYALIACRLYEDMVKGPCECLDCVEYRSETQARLGVVMF